MNNYAVWDLPTFCSFYGRVIPCNSLDENKFSKFHTSSRNNDDLYVSFDENLEPMTFMNMLALSRSLYVVGHGEAVEDWGGRCFFEKYTMFDAKGLTIFLENITYKHNVKSVFDNLEEMEQSIIRRKSCE